MITNQMNVLNAAYAAAGFAFTIVSTDTCVRAWAAAVEALGSWGIPDEHRSLACSPGPLHRPAPDPGW
jgi:hypothetical protein